MAVRLVMNAAARSAVVRVRLAALRILTPSGNKASSRASPFVSLSAASSSIRTSMRDNQPTWSSQTCAVAISVTSRLSKPAESSSSNTPIRTAGWRRPLLETSKASPITRPSESAVVRDSVTAPGRVRKSRNSVSAASESSSVSSPASTVNVRISPSANRSTPRICTLV